MEPKKISPGKTQKEELDALVKTIKERTGHGEDDDIETVDDIDPFKLFAPDIDLIRNYEYNRNI